MSGRTVLEERLLEVIFSVLNVISTNYMDVSMAFILLIVQKVDFFEEALFVMLQFPHFSRTKFLMDCCQAEIDRREMVEFDSWTFGVRSSFTLTCASHPPPHHDAQSIHHSNIRRHSSLPTNSFFSIFPILHLIHLPHRPYHQRSLPFRTIKREGILHRRLHSEMDIRQRTRTNLCCRLFQNTRT